MVGQQTLGICLPSFFGPVPKGYIHDQDLVHDYHVDASDSNSDPHAWKSYTLSTEMSSLP